jgi:zinc transporter 1/2/3
LFPSPSGILLWTGLVELIAHEFLFNTEFQKRSTGQCLYAFTCVALGAGIVSLYPISSRPSRNI